MVVESDKVDAQHISPRFLSSSNSLKLAFYNQSLPVTPYPRRVVITNNVPHRLGNSIHWPGILDLLSSPPLPYPTISACSLPRPVLVKVRLLIASAHFWPK